MLFALRALCFMLLLLMIRRRHIDAFFISSYFFRFLRHTPLFRHGFLRFSPITPFFFFLSPSSFAATFHDDAAITLLMPPR